MCGRRRMVSRPVEADRPGAAGVRSAFKPLEQPKDGAPVAHRRHGSEGPVEARVVEVGLRRATIALQAAALRSTIVGRSPNFARIAAAAAAQTSSGRSASKTTLPLWMTAAASLAPAARKAA